MKFLKEQKYLIISIVIDKENHYRRYGDAARHPYHYSFAALLERYCGKLNFENNNGDVLAESRGGMEDRQLKLAYDRLYKEGTFYRSASFFQTALTSHEIKLKPKWRNISGLQIADVLAHPCKQEILKDHKIINEIPGIFGGEICKCVSAKYNRQEFNGIVQGYGKILLE